MATEPDIIAGVARIDVQGATAGAGFLVAERVVVTCAHVAGSGVDVRVVLGGYGRGARQWSCGATLRAGGSPSHVDDVAVLELVDAPPEQFRPLRVAPSAGTARHQIICYGFPRDILAQLSRITAVRGKGTVADERERLLQVDSQEITRGFSGGPIWDVERRAVIGIVDCILGEDEFGKLPNVAFATQSEILAKYVPEIQLTEECPFRGLDSFRAGDARFFERTSALLVESMSILSRHPRGLALVGPSGCGKSSFLNAQLLPHLREHPTLDLEGARWTIVTQHDTPFTALALPGLPIIGPKTKCEVEPLLTAAGLNRWVIVIDAFEAIVRRAAALDTHAQDFLTFLAGILEQGCVTLIVGMRSDAHEALGAVAPPMLLDVLDRGERKLPPLLDPAEIDSIISKPLQRVGCVAQDDLLAILKQDLANGSNSSSGSRVPSTMLPVLQLTLSALWARRHPGGPLTLDSYRHIGGIGGCIAHIAGKALGGASSKPPPEIVRWVVLQLCQIVLTDDDVRAFRLRRRRSELLTRAGARAPLVANVLERLIACRLLATGANDTVEVVHETIFRSWDDCARWIRDGAAASIYFASLETRALAWQDRVKGSQHLSRTEVNKALSFGSLETDAAEPVRSYVLRSQRAHRLSQWIAFGSAAALVVLAIVAIRWYTNRTERQKQFDQRKATFDAYRERDRVRFEYAQLLDAAGTKETVQERHDLLASAEAVGEKAHWDSRGFEWYFLTTTLRTSPVKPLGKFAQSSQVVLDSSGTTLAAAGPFGIYLFDTRDPPRSAWHKQGRGGSVVAFSESGVTLATLSRYGEAPDMSRSSIDLFGREDFFALQSGHSFRSLPEASYDEATRIAIDAEGDRVVANVPYHTGRAIMTATQGTPATDVQVLELPPELWPRSLAVANSRVLFVSATGSLYEIEGDRRPQLKLEFGHEAPVLAAELSANGDYVVVAHRDSVAIARTDSGTIIHSVSAAGAERVAVSASGDMFAWVQGASVSVSSAPAWGVAELQLGTSPTSLSVARGLVATIEDGRPLLYRLGDPPWSRRRFKGSNPWPLMLAPNSSVAAWCERQGQICVLHRVSLVSGAELPIVELEGMPIAMSATGENGWTELSDGELDSWQIDGQAVSQKALLIDDAPITLGVASHNVFGAFAPSGDGAFLTSSLGGIVAKVASKNNLVKVADVPAGIRGRFLDAGRLVLVDRTEVTIVNASSGERRVVDTDKLTSSHPYDTVEDVQLSPDGDIVLLTKSGLIALDGSTYQLKWWSKANYMRYAGGVVDPAGSRVLRRTGGGVELIVPTCSEGEREVPVFTEGNDARVRTALFSPDGKNLLLLDDGGLEIFHAQEARAGLFCPCGWKEYCQP